MEQPQNVGGAMPTVDGEFARLVPPLSPQERRSLEMQLRLEGCRDPLVIWNGHNILLDGHNRRQICEAYGIPYVCVGIDLPDREAARSWIVRQQLARRNLTPEAAAFLRGQRYLAEKQSHGGDRKGEGSRDHNGPLKTAQRLAREYKLGETTIKRDANFARAVDAIVENCGPEARALVLSRDTGLSQGQIRQLAKKSPDEQREYVHKLMENGKPPRRPRGEGLTITLPKEPEALVEKLVARLIVTRPGGCCTCWPRPWTKRKSLDPEGARTGREG